MHISRRRSNSNVHPWMTDKPEVVAPMGQSSSVTEGSAVLIHATACTNLENTTHHCEQRSQAQKERGCLILLQHMSRRGQSAGRRLMSGWKGGVWEMTDLAWEWLSSWDDENVWELDKGGGCTTL